MAFTVTGIIAGIVSAWKNTVKVISRFQLIFAWMKGAKDQAKKQEDAEQEEEDDALSEKRKFEDASDEDIRRRLRGDVSDGK